MDFEAVKKGINSGDFVLIDVRSPDEVRNDGKIPSSHLIPRKYILYIHEQNLGGALCVEIGFYADISKESRCNSEIKFELIFNHEGARHRRKPLGRHSMGFEISTVIIIYIFFAFTHSNIDFH